MKDLVDVLRKTLMSSPDSAKGSGTSPMIFVKSRRGILKELRNSFETGNLLGVYSKALGEGMFLTGVSNIEDDTKEEVVTFETYDQSGEMLNRTRVSIEEIKMVCSFEKKYLNPILNKIQFA